MRMNQSKLKINPFNKMDRDFKYDARQLIKVFDKESKSYIFNVVDIKIKLSQDRVKLYLIKKLEEKLIIDLCMKHTLISRATDAATPKIDSCRLISDPAGNEVLLNFKSPSIANEYELKFLESMGMYNTTYANICFDVNVTNLVNKSLKESANVSLSGLTLGKDLKSWIEQEFVFPDIHMPCYILELRVGEELLTIRDDTTILQVYEHINYSNTKGHCFLGCFYESIKPNSTLLIQINFYNHTIEYEKGQIPYSIEEKWGVGEMPKWLTRLLSDIYYDGPDSKGVFRLNAKDSSFSKWYKHMLDCDDFIISEDIFNKAAIFKFFLRNIEGSIMTKNTRKQFNGLCKKFMEISFEEFFKNSKRQSKFIKLIQSLPKPHFFLFQNILVVLSAIIDSPNTKVEPFAIARAIAPSIFPLVRLNYWGNLSNLLEAAIYLTDKIVKPADRKRIIESYNKVKIETNNLKNENRINSTTFGENDSITLSSITESDSKLQNTISSDKLYDCELDKDSDLENFSQDSILSDNVSSSDIESDSSNKSCDYPSEEKIKNLPQTSSEKQLEMDERNICEIESNEMISKFQNSKNICMGLKMKQIYRSCSKFQTDSEFQIEKDNFKEKLSPVLRNEKKTVGQRHKSLIQSDSLVKALDRDAFEFSGSDFVIVKDNIKENFSPVLRKDIKNIGQRHKSLIQPDSSMKPLDIMSPKSSKNVNSSSSTPVDFPVKRKYSRKALSVVSELNNNNNVCENNNHRSRSPYVKKLIKLYENKK